jgi:putative transposase
MYSYEDSIRAGELYVKLGERIKATIRQLGYPTKNALKGWYHEYEQRLDLPEGCAVRAPKYSQAQQEAAVKHYLIRILTDQNPCAHSLCPMDMMRHGWLSSFRQA